MKLKTMFMASPLKVCAMNVYHGLFTQNMDLSCLMASQDGLYVMIQITTYLWMKN
jgi:hypothetical protein